LILYQQRCETGQFATNNDTLRAQLIIQKTNTYIRHNAINENLLHEIERVNTALITDKLLLKTFLWNAALSYYLQQKHSESFNYISHYNDACNDTLLNNTLIQCLLLMQLDNERMLQKVSIAAQQDTSFNALTCYMQVLQYELRKNKYVTASAILPGTGMFMLGKPVQGINSLLLNAGTIVLGGALWRNGLYFNSLA
jgi:hypothetical protein